MATLEILHPDISNLPSTALTAAGAAAATSLTVENGLAFSASEWVVIEGYGSAKSEIRRIAASAPTATAITLNSATALQFAHGLGTPLQKIPYDQIAIEYSTDLDTNWELGTYTTIASASAASTWTALTTIDIEPNQQMTVYDDTSDTGNRSYRTRYYNSNSTVYSGYSDPILSSGFEEYSVGRIIDKARRLMGVDIGKEDDSQISEYFMLDAINMCLREIHSKRKRWSWNQEFNYQISEITAGKNYYSIPTSMDLRYSKKSMLKVRINDNEPLTYLDKVSFDEKSEDAHTTTTAGSLTSASTTLVLTDSSDFVDSGTFSICTGATEDTITYTANNRSTNTLTLASTNGASTTHASGTDIWEDGDLDEPLYYTLFENYLYLWPVPDTDYYLMNIKADFYKKLTEIDSANDYILFPNPNIVVWYLCYCIAMRLKNYEEITLYKQNYESALTDLIRNEHTGQNNQFTLGVKRAERD